MVSKTLLERDLGWIICENSPPGNGKLSRKFFPLCFSLGERDLAIYEFASASIVDWRQIAVQERRLGQQQIPTLQKT